MSSLIEKMYDDGKYAAKERQRKKEAVAKKAEAEKKRQEAREKRSRKKKKGKKEKKKLTTNEKIVITGLIVVFVPIVVLIHIYLQAGLLDSILVATTAGAVKNLSAPIDPKKIPYYRQGVGDKNDPRNHPSNSKSVFEIIDENRKPMVQKGGNIEKFDKALNTAKGFTDPGKWGWPYSWCENENWLMNSTGNYFSTFFITIRSVFVKYMQTLNEAIGDEVRKQPDGLFDKVKDFAIFAWLMPVCNLILFIGQYVVSAGAIIWAAINNQNIFSIGWLIVAFCCIVFGWAQFPQYFWPFQFVSIYLTLFMLRLKPSKTEIFRTYGKRYKLCWAALIVFIWFLGISFVWDWHPTAMIASGAVPAAMLFLTAIGFAASV